MGYRSHYFITLKRLDGAEIKNISDIIIAINNMSNCSIEDEGANDSNEVSLRINDATWDDLIEDCEGLTSDLIFKDIIIEIKEESEIEHECGWLKSLNGKVIWESEVRTYPPISLDRLQGKINKEPEQVTLPKQLVKTTLMWLAKAMEQKIHEPCASPNSLVVTRDQMQSIYDGKLQEPEPVTPPLEMHKLTVIYGEELSKNYDNGEVSVEEIKSNNFSCDGEAINYLFNNSCCLSSFKDGIEAGNGWDNYAFIEDDGKGGDA